MENSKKTPNEAGFDAEEGIDQNLTAENSRSELPDRVERLKKLISQNGGNLQVASKTGIPVSTLNKYVAGRDLKASAMIALARACGVSLDWFATGDGPSGQDNRPSSTASGKSNTSFLQSEIGSIPYYDLQSGKKSDITREQNAESGRIPFPLDLLPPEKRTRMDSLSFVRSPTDAMAPTIEAGELLVVDTENDKVISDGIYAFDVNGRVLLRRVELQLDGSAIFRTDNGKHASAPWSAETLDALKVIGQVVLRIGRVS